MKTIRWLAVIATVAILGGDAAAQKQFSDVAKATVEIIPAKARPGEAVIWRLTIEVVPGWHTYPTKQDNEEASATKTKIVWPKQGDLIFVGDLVEKPAPTLVTENGVPTW
jgi:ABC-type Fe3+ transport system substrate-binding protein